MLNEVGEKLSAGVLHQVVKPDARANKHFLYLGNLTKLAQQHHVVGVVGVQVRAGLGGQTGPVFTHAVLELLLTGGTAEGGRGTAHVVNIALEAGVLGQGLYLPDDALVAAAGDDSTLVEGQRAEVAGAKATTVVGH